MWPISITVSDLVQIDQELAEICRRHLEFSKRDIWTLDDTRISTPNLVQIGQELAEIYNFVHFSRWRPPPSSIFK